MPLRTSLTLCLTLLTAALLAAPVARGADAKAEDSPAPETPAPIKALLITGGCCHDYPKQKEILAQGIAQRARVQWKIVHIDTTARDVQADIYKQPDWAKGYDVVVHNECFGSVNDDKFVEGIAKAHADGVGAVMIHCSLHSYRAAKTDEWRKCLGVSSYSHEKHRPVTVKLLKKDHPVMAGFPAEWKTPNGELYKIEKVWPNTIPLAQAYGQDTKTDHVCIWVNTYGKGRVFGTSLGHHNETMSHEVYLDLVTRGLLWSAGKLDDKGKPAKGYEVSAANPSPPIMVTRRVANRDVTVTLSADPTVCNCAAPGFATAHRKTQHTPPTLQQQSDSPDLR